MEAVAGYANAWLKECKDFHPLCASDEEPPLPARVLELTRIHDAPSIKLIETKGSKGRYVALSHCWGPPSKRPLRTTRANIQDHMSGIDFDRLPKTFQDAAMFAQGIGVDYLWIDSLCIIQNDAVDWHSEAKNMGAIYRNASIVVAASDATHSSGGLFVSDRARRLVKKAPYLRQKAPESSEWIADGTFNICRRFYRDSRPSNGILDSRAWTLQERYLARRIMFFTETNIFWRCRTSQISEAGSVAELGFAEETGWINLVQNYTSKNMTNPGDRLYALRGIVDDMKQYRKDYHHYEYGAWDSGLAFQILWRQKELPLPQETLNLPSWTWASLGGEKSWDAASSAVTPSTSTEFKINARGSLCATAHLSIGPLRLQRLLDKHRSMYAYCWLVKKIIDASRGHSNCLAYFVQGDGVGHPTIGVAFFDRAVSRNARCMFVLSDQNFSTRVYHRV